MYLKSFMKVNRNKSFTEIFNKKRLPKKFWTASFLLFDTEMK